MCNTILRDINHNILPNPAGFGKSCSEYISTYKTAGSAGTNLGVTTDVKYSGLVADLSGDFINSKQLGYFFIKF